MPSPVTVPPHASQGPSETLISPPAKPFSLHGLLPEYMVKSLPSSTHQTNKTFFDLMPCLSSALFTHTPQSLPTIYLLTEKTSHRRSPSSSWAQLDSVSQSPLQLAVATYTGSGQWDVSGREQATWAPAPYTCSECFLLLALLGAGSMQMSTGAFARLVQKMVVPQERGARVSESF